MYQKLFCKLYSSKNFKYKYELNYTLWKTFENMNVFNVRKCF